jgi:hypothetical protein
MGPVGRCWRPVHGRIVRIGVTLNVTLAWNRPLPGRILSVTTDFPPEGRSDSFECTGVDMIRTAGGGADLLSHPGARGGLNARLGASLDSREDVSPGSHREEPQERT